MDKFHQFQIDCLPHLGGKTLEIQVPWVGITVDEFKAMMATARGYVPPKKTEAELKQEAIDRIAAGLRWEQKQFEKAEKIEFGSRSFPMYFSESVLWNDGYFRDLEELLDCCDCGGLEIPSYVWGCKTVYPCQDTAQSIVEDSFDCLYEDAADQVFSQSITELQSALDKFYETNQHIVGYQPDYRVALLLPKSGGGR